MCFTSILLEVLYVNNLAKNIYNSNMCFTSEILLVTRSIIRAGARSYRRREVPLPLAMSMKTSHINALFTVFNI